jgi:hypothetical protein
MHAVLGTSGHGPRSFVENQTFLRKQRRLDGDQLSYFVSSVASWMLCLQTAPSAVVGYRAAVLNAHTALEACRAGWDSPTPPKTTSPPAHAWHIRAFSCTDARNGLLIGRQNASSIFGF